MSTFTSQDTRGALQTKFASLHASEKHSGFHWRFVEGSRPLVEISYNAPLSASEFLPGPVVGHGRRSGEP